MISLSSTYKPLLRNSTRYVNGTYVDNVFQRVELTPLIDDIEYNLNLDCKQAIPANVTINVSTLNSEEQMCMYQLQGAPVDLFSILRQIADYSVPLDVKWYDDKTIEVTNEDVSFISSVLPMTTLNLTRVSNKDCKF